MKPCRYALERIPIGNIINNENPMRTSVVTAHNGLEPILPCSVPLNNYKQVPPVALHSYLVYPGTWASKFYSLLKYIVNTDCRIVSWKELIFTVAHENGGLARARVSDQQNFQREVSQFLLKRYVFLLLEEVILFYEPFRLREGCYEELSIWFDLVL